MASIHKLSLSGVRSFGIEEREIIAFGKPLTLIVGANGTGKTTIIEALRYATTGILPPNSKGGAFVHDPRMEGVFESIAQIKLAYYNAKHQQMVCTRNMQLTIKPKTQTFKTLEGQLVVIDRNGDKRAVSSKCSDLDSQVPLSLGVPVAILNYVIFCHQEESLWPLAEPSLVKKRFDDIFEATKYTNALNTIKALKKEYTIEMKLQEKTIQYLKQDVERADALKDRNRILKSKITDYEKECEQLKLELQNTTSSLNALFEQNQKFQENIYQLQEARKSSSYLQDTIDSLKYAESLLENSTEVLEGKLAQLADEKELEENRLGLVQEKNDKLKQQEEISNSLNNLSGTWGALEVKLSNYEADRRRLEELKNLFPKDINDIDEFEKKIVQVKDEIASTEISRDSELSQLRVSLDKAISQLAEKEQILKARLGAITQDTNEVAKLKAELVEAVATAQKHDSIEFCEKLVEEARSELFQARENLNELIESQKLQKTQQSLLDLQLQRDITSDKLTQAASARTDQSRLAVLLESVQRKEYKHSASKTSVASRFETLVGGYFDEDSAQDLFKKEIDSNGCELDRNRNVVASLTQKALDLRARLETANSELELLKNEADAKEKEVKSLISVEITEFDTCLIDAEVDLATATQNKEQSQFALNFFNMACTEAKDGNMCLLCQRELSEDDLKVFIESVTTRKNALPLSEADAQNQCESAQKRVDSLKNLTDIVSRYHHITAPGGLISTKLELVSSLEESIAQTEKALTSSQEALNSLVSRSEELHELQAQLVEFFRIKHELDNLKKDADELQQEVNTTYSQVESPAEIQERLTGINSSLRSLEVELSLLRSREMNYKDDIASKERLMSRREMALKDLKLIQQSTLAKQSIISGIEARIQLAEESVESLQADVNASKRVLEESEMKLSEAKQEYNRQELQLKDLLVSLERVYNEYIKTRANVNSFIELHGEDPLTKLQEQIKQKESDLVVVRDQLANLEHELSRVERLAADMDKEKRTISDALRLRQLHDELNMLEHRISNLEKLGSERDKAKYENETNSLQQKLSELSSDHSSRLGEVKQMMEQFRQNDAELNGEYKTVHEDYKKATVKLDLTETATEDMVKYAVAIDEAIIEFHSMKMKEINKILDELWKTTYTGTDVDTILIKSEAEGRGNRTYNYRVCMVKQTVELDMRGRCSAGQKVLAAVLIRLALAECFGANCGLIVLDEPTTNLDETNGEALAKSLSHIIESRRAQDNFQLIVITHDEGFLQHINASAFCDHFYSIQRDERQLSRIRKNHITFL